MEGNVVHVLKYFAINSSFTSSPESFYLMALTSEKTTTGLGEDKDSVPHYCSSPSPEGKLLPPLFLFPHLQSRNDDKGLFYKAFFELENTATVVQVQTMVPVLKEMERGQMLGYTIQAELHRGTAVWLKVHGRPRDAQQHWHLGQEIPPLPDCSPPSSLHHPQQHSTHTTLHCSSSSDRV